MFAIPVPTTPKIKIKRIECCVFSKTKISENPEKYKIKQAGSSITAKFPVEIVSGYKSDKYFLIKFTFIA